MARKVNLKTVFNEGEDKIAFEDKLIGLVEPESHIWNVEDTEFKNKLRRQNTFSKLGEILGKSGEVCLAIWDNLRSQYYASKRRLPTGSGANAKSGFRHNDSMSFLSGFSKSSSTMSNVRDSPVRGLETIDESDLRSITLDDSADGIDNGHSYSHAQPDELNQPSIAAPRVHSKFQGKRKLDQMEQEMLTILKSGESPQVEDEFDAIGKAIAHKLRKINAKDPKLSSECQFKFHQILHEAELEILWPVSSN